MPAALFCVAALAALTGCAAGTASSTPPATQAPAVVAMPEVTGAQLDVALSDLARFGIPEEDVEIVGGGTFGVVNESAWLVCSQDPAAGEEAVAVRVIVDRSCDEAQEPAADVTSPEPEDSTDDSESAEPDDSTGADDSADDESTDAASEPEPFEMPNLVGQNLQDAQDLLQTFDSYLLDQEDASGLDRMQMVDANWTVCEQDPAPGMSTTVEDVVTLWSVKLDETCP
jgi:hypothetical protein